MLSLFKYSFNRDRGARWQKIDSMLKVQDKNKYLLFFIMIL